MMVVAVPEKDVVKMIKRKRRKEDMSVLTITAQ